MLPRLTTIATECGASTCPAVHLAETRSLYVQGRRASDAVRALLTLTPDEEVVEVPTGLIERAAEQLRALSS